MLLVMTGTEFGAITEVWFVYLVALGGGGCILLLVVALLASLSLRRKVSLPSHLAPSLVYETYMYNLYTLKSCRY